MLDVDLITVIDLAWLAGLLEGEGSFFVNERKNDKRTPAARISMQSTDKDVLDRVHFLLGGSLSNAIVRKNRPNAKPAWQWCLSNTSYCVELCKRLYPLMSERRQGQINSIFERFDNAA